MRYRVLFDDRDSEEGEQDGQRGEGEQCDAIGPRCASVV
jgi:hypothetical protein